MDILELRDMKAASERRIAEFIQTEKAAFEEATAQIVVGVELTFVDHYTNRALDGSLLIDVSIKLPPL
jgi:hypothetical protein